MMHSLAQKRQRQTQVCHSEPLLFEVKNCTGIFIVFIFVFQWCNKDVRCKKLQLTDLLVSPVHHIMKIPLVIREIESRTDDPEEKSVISRIHEMKEHSLSMKNDFDYSALFTWCNQLFSDLF